MNIYERFGIKPIICVSGPKTRNGGSLMEEEALKAMYDAAHYSVNMFELEAVASKIIAQKTHAEAGLVTCGCFHSLTLAAAACICGFNVSKMNRLPDTTGIPHEFLMPWHQMSGYDHSIKAAGGKIIPVGLENRTFHPYEVVTITARDVEAEIDDENTVGILYAARHGSHPPLQEVIKVAKRYQVPVIIDAAAQVPPVENLHRFIDMGADLVCISGGKGIRGPQASGILCGKKELISSAAMQMLDMGIKPFDEWEPPKDFILKEKLRGRPAHGIGRGSKVSKEAIIGLLVALENLNSDKLKQKFGYLKNLLEQIGSLTKEIEGVETQMSEEYKDAYPMLMVKINEKKLGKSVNDVVKELKTNYIFPRDDYKDKGFFYIHSGDMNEKTAKIVGEKLFQILKTK